MLQLVRARTPQCLLGKKKRGKRERDQPVLPDGDMCGRSVHAFDGFSYAHATRISL